MELKIQILPSGKPRLVDATNILPGLYIHKSPESPGGSHTIYNISHKSGIALISNIKDQDISSVIKNFSALEWDVDIDVIATSNTYLDVIINTRKEILNLKYSLKELADKYKFLANTDKWELHNQNVGILSDKTPIVCNISDIHKLSEALKNANNIYIRTIDVSNFGQLCITALSHYPDKLMRPTVKNITLENNEFFIRRQLIEHLNNISFIIKYENTYYVLFSYNDLIKWSKNEF